MTSSISWGFSRPLEESGLASAPSSWRPKAELLMAMHSLGIAKIEGLYNNELLGRGTSFTVHACVMPKFNKLVAVKRLNRARTDNEDVLWDPEQELPSIVIEFADCGTLDKFLQIRGGFLDSGWDLCRTLCLDVAVALEVLHSHGIIHGDVKLENILVYFHEEKYATARLSDFGHSRFDIPAGEAVSYIGTPLNNPPEVLRYKYDNQQKLGIPKEELPKCDVWSFGLMMWSTMNGGKGFFQQDWLSHGQSSANKLDFLMQNPPGYLRQAARDFISHPNSLRGIDVGLKGLFAELLSECLHGDSKKRCNMQEASILLDTKRDWEHLENVAFQNEQQDLKKISFRTLQILDCVHSDFPWSFRKSFFEDLVEVEKACDLHGRRALKNGYDGTRGLCYVIALAMSPFPEGGDSCKAWDIALCYATGFGVQQNIEHLLEILGNQFNVIPGTTESLINRIRAAHGREAMPSTSTEAERWSPDEWFSQSIITYQQTMFKAHQGQIISARFRGVEITLSKGTTTICRALTYPTLPSPHELVNIIRADGTNFNRPLLHFAVSRANTELVSRLIEQGVDIDMRDSEERTALFEACAVGNLEIALLLLSHGANPCLREFCGAYPLHMIVFFSSSDVKEIANALIHAGAEPNVTMYQDKAFNLGWHGITIKGTPLHFAVSCRNAAAIRSLIEVGADVNFRYNFRSPLDFAAAHHLPDICALLIEKGAKVDPYWATGHSPMHLIADSSICPSFGRWVIHGSRFCTALDSTIRLLVGHGLSIQMPEKLNGDTALSIALKDRAENAYIIRALLNQHEMAGIPIDPALIFPTIETSSYTDNCSALTKFLSYGFQPSIQDSDGNSPFHHCIVKGATAALHALAAQPNIDINIENRQGFTPLHLVSNLGNKNFVTVLCDFEASVNSKVNNTNNTETALGLATLSANVDVIYLLLQNQADPWLDNRSYGGPTFLHKAARRELISQAMNSAHVGINGLPILHPPTDSLISNIFSHERSSELYTLIKGDRALLNAKNNTGQTCLHIAIESADLVAVGILLHAGADRSQTDSTGKSLPEYIEWTFNEMKKWKGGHVAEFKEVFDEMRNII